MPHATWCKLPSYPLSYLQKLATRQHALEPLKRQESPPADNEFHPSVLRWTLFLFQEVCSSLSEDISRDADHCHAHITYVHTINFPVSLANLFSTSSDSTVPTNIIEFSTFLPFEVETALPWVEGRSARFLAKEENEIASDSVKKRIQTAMLTGKRMAQRKRMLQSFLKMVKPQIYPNFCEMHEASKHPPE